MCSTNGMVDVVEMYDRSVEAEGGSVGSGGMTRGGSVAMQGWVLAAYSTASSSMVIVVGEACTAL